MSKTKAIARGSVVRTGRFVVGKSRFHRGSPLEARGERAGGKVIGKLHFQRGEPDGERRLQCL